VEEYQMGDWMLLSTKDLKYQIKRRQSEKLTKYFVGSYQVKGIVSTNVIELDLPSTVRIHPVVNVSRVWRYKDQVEDQKKERPASVRATGHKTPEESSVDITDCNYDTTHLQENSQRLG